MLGSHIHAISLRQPFQTKVGDIYGDTAQCALNSPPVRADTLNSCDNTGDLVYALICSSMWVDRHVENDTYAVVGTWRYEKEQSKSIITEESVRNTEQEHGVSAVTIAGARDDRGTAVEPDGVSLNPSHATDIPPHTLVDQSFPAVRTVGVGAATATRRVEERYIGIRWSSTSGGNCHSKDQSLSVKYLTSSKDESSKTPLLKYSTSGEGSNSHNQLCKFIRMKIPVEFMRDSVSASSSSAHSSTSSQDDGTLVKLSFYAPRDGINVRRNKNVVLPTVFI